MFSKLFRKKKPYAELQTNAVNMRFLGEPTGIGLGQLKEELTKILIVEGNTSKAYLSRVQYSGEEKVRIALIVDGTQSAEKIAVTIARKCQPIAAIDIVFFESLTQSLIHDIQQCVPPFYIAPCA